MEINWQEVIEEHQASTEQMIGNSIALRSDRSA